MNNAEEFLRRGRLAREDNDLALAFEWLEQAVRIDGENAAVCKELARASLAADEMRAFVNWCHEAIRIDPADAEPHWMMAEVLAARDRWQEASDEARLALERRGLDWRDRARAEALLAAAEDRLRG
jgi:cytochrome c-type biogenesis protein CcmH/NrfG